MCYGDGSNERDLISIDPGKLPAIQERHNISPTVSRFGHFRTLVSFHVSELIHTSGIADHIVKQIKIEEMKTKIAKHLVKI